MLIWRGWGILAVLIPGLFMVLVHALSNAMFGDGTYQQFNDWLVALALLLGAAVVWPLGRWLNNKPGRALLDQATGQQVVLRREHSLFFVKMEYWAAVLAVVAVILVATSAL